MKNLNNKTWGSLTVSEKENMLNIAMPVNAIDGATVSEGECIIDFADCEYSICGKVVDSEIIIDDTAVFYNPII